MLRGIVVIEDVVHIVVICYIVDQLFNLV